MRRRRQPQEDLHNKERWLISYADFITLLFAFFVVMYSVSSVNEGKYKVLSDTFTGVFNAPQRSLQPIPIGENPAPQVEQRDSSSESADEQKMPELDTEQRAQVLQTMANQLELEFDELINRGVVTLEATDQWLELNLPNSMLFNSGTAEPHYDAFTVMEKVATVIQDRDNAVKVEGFTDNQAIRTNRFPSNWELSAARASAVVRMLAMEGIDPARMAAVGYGQYQPVARNDTEEGRRRNRRVVLLISKDSSIRGAMR